MFGLEFPDLINRRLITHAINPLRSDMSVLRSIWGLVAMDGNHITIREDGISNFFKDMKRKRKNSEEVIKKK
jgi:hypothetical protein